MGENDEGFTGGMTGASGAGGFSAEGNPGPTSSSATDPNPASLIDPEELDGAVIGPLPVPQPVIDAVGPIIDGIHAVTHGGHPPLLIVNPNETIHEIVGTDDTVSTDDGS